MASTSQTHPAFSSRPYSALHSTTKLPDRGAQSLGFGASSHANSAREARIERDRSAAVALQQSTAITGPNTTATAAATAGGSMAQLTDEQRDEINEAFGLFDLDKDNLIDYHEFKVALKALGFDLPKPDLLSLLTTHGTAPPSLSQSQLPRTQNPSSAQGPSPTSQIPPSRLHLTLPAFQAIASSLIAARDPREEILRAFDLFDNGGKGMITLEDLRRVARELNEGLEEEELIAMIEEFDLEGKGGVGREEFVGICMG